MNATIGYYRGFAYGIPFGAFAVIFLLMTIIGKRVDWFLLHTILGIDWDNKKNGNSNDSDNSNNCTRCGQPTTNPKNKVEEKQHISTYLYIDLDDNVQQGISSLRCFVRFFSDLLASSILAIFVAIIFNSLILTNDGILIGAQCPDYNADCFGKNGTSDVGPLPCSRGLYANFSIDSRYIWCTGWVYQDKGIHDVLDTLGICGGLLGIIASVVPFVYYLSYHKNRCLTICCVILPIITVITLCLTIWHTLPIGPSQITVIVFSVAIAIVFFSWCWAVYWSCVNTPPMIATLESWTVCRSCVNILHMIEILKCWGCCQKLSRRPCIRGCYRGCSWFCCRKIKFYPWCLIYRYCVCHCCGVQWNCNGPDYCKEEEDRENTEHTKAHDCLPPSVGSVVIDQYHRSTESASASPSRLSPKNVP